MLAANAAGMNRFTLLRPLAGGESGQPIFLLAGADGGQYVLKWCPGAQRMVGWQRAARAATVLRQRGYSAPSHDVIGSTPAGSYVVQQYLQGRPTRCFTAGQLPMLLRLSSLQAGAAPAAALPDADWPAPVITPVLEGGDGYCELASLRRHSAETRELLRTVQRLAAAGLSATYRTTDIVHYDWGPGNVLTEGDTVSGVIDWDAVCAGDRSFDLATALFYSADDAVLREGLWAALLELVPPVVVGAYLAHLILRQVDWSLRHHSAAVAATWLEHARVMLTDIRVRTAL